MEIKLKILLVIIFTTLFLIVSCVIGFIYIIAWPGKNQIEIPIPATNEKVYITIRYGGMGDSWQNTYISMDKYNYDDKNSSFMSNEVENHYYKISNDTLMYFSFAKFRFPNEFKSKVKIIIIELNNSEYQEMNQNYKERGLRKIPIYGKEENE